MSLTPNGIKSSPISGCLTLISPGSMSPLRAGSLPLWLVLDVPVRGRFEEGCVGDVERRRRRRRLWFLSLSLSLSLSPSRSWRRDRRWLSSFFFVWSLSRLRPPREPEGFGGRESIESDEEKKYPGHVFALWVRPECRVGGCLILKVLPNIPFRIFSFSDTPVSDFGFCYRTVYRWIDSISTLFNTHRST